MPKFRGPINDRRGRESRGETDCVNFGNMVNLILEGTDVFKMRIRRLFSSPVFADEEQTRRAWVLHFTLWSILLVIDSQFYVAFFIMPQHWARWLASLLTINFMLPPLLLLNRRGHTRLAGILLVVTLWVQATVSALTAGGIQAPAILAFVVDVLIAGLLFGEIGGVIMGIISCLTGLGFVLLETTGHLPANRVTPTAMSLWVNLTLFLEFIVIFQFLANHSIKAGLKQAMQELHRRRQTEIALSESERRYREVYRNHFRCHCRYGRHGRGPIFIESMQSRVRKGSRGCVG